MLQPPFLFVLHLVTICITQMIIVIQAFCGIIACAVLVTPFLVTCEEKKAKPRLVERRETKNGQKPAQNSVRKAVASEKKNIASETAPSVPTKDSALERPKDRSEKKDILERTQAADKSTSSRRDKSDTEKKEKKPSKPTTPHPVQPKSSEKEKKSKESPIIPLEKIQKKGLLDDYVTKQKTEHDKEIEALRTETSVKRPMPEGLKVTFNEKKCELWETKQADTLDDEVQDDEDR